MRFALEHQNPLAIGLVTGGTAYPEKSYSLLNVSRPKIFVWSVKPSEEGIGQGMMARVWNIAHNPVDGALDHTDYLCDPPRPRIDVSPDCGR
jgi:alpha-mannosidase